MYVCRRLFVVLLADNNHGKSTVMNAVLSQGLGRASPGRKGVRELTSPWGRKINALVFARSYQETEKANHGSVEAALDAADHSWRERELVILPSHVTGSRGDLTAMIATAHAGGFDAICATVILAWPSGAQRTNHAAIWGMDWDERWTLPNPKSDEWAEQTGAIGRDLWTWMCRALAS